MGAYSHLLTWHVAAAALSGAFSVAAAIPYIRDVLRRNTKPNAVSFSLWAILNAIALAAQWKAGASWSIVLVAFLTLNAAMVAVLSFAGYGYRKYGTVDYVCIALAILAIAGWQITGNPVLAILLAIVADACASLPTIVKTWREPHTEHVGAWALVTAASIFGVAAANITNVANLAFPIYFVLMNGLILGFAYFGQKSAKAKA